MAASPAWAQVGQSGMAQPGGLVNRAMNLIGPVGADGPGLFYYGINAADRGLGYRGSYMTLGGFIPAVQDDLGGFWSADLRTHLSQYGGFFSNVGAVRKQFIGGTILGVGVYWDYDGDMNQYPTTLIPGTSTLFPGGQAYNQVGVSGEWLTDWGNLRSNGYIPLGSTAQYVGPFVDNRVLCVNGINAALGGVDLEVGAYIPGLSDWAGMISVGGYGYGNAAYTWDRGPEAGQAVVPWFGGVFTRLDMTFIENWDFSLQANNDSYFDWTGFARLTYRMGASRRRNVPDQMEQPMMRNEHIVRAYQQPSTAINPATGDFWRLFYVDNSAAAGGTGTVESPFTTLTQAETAATLPYDIVYVSAGNSGTSPYVTPVNGYRFNAPNQLLVGEGSDYLLPTLNCGPSALFASVDSAYPVISNQSASLLGIPAAAIVIDQPGVTVSHLQIVDSPIGISDGPGPGVIAPGVATVSDVIITGNSGINTQRGVEIAHSTGRFNFDRMQLQNLGDAAFVMSAANGNATLTNSQITDARGHAILVSGNGARLAVDAASIRGTVGTAIEAAGTGARIAVANSTISGTTSTSAGAAVTDRGLVASGSNSTILTDATTVERLRGPAVVASGANSTIRGTTTVVQRIDGDALVSSGTNANIILTSSTVSRVAGFGARVSGDGSGLYLTDNSRIESVESNGIHVTGRNNTVLLQDSRIISSAVNGIYVDPAAGSTNTQVTLLRSEVRDSGAIGVWAVGVGSTATLPNDSVVQIFSSTISSAGSIGVLAQSSSVDIGRDPTNAASAGSRIVGTGEIGISTEGYSAVRVQNSEISGVDVGIFAEGAIAFAGNPPATLTNNLVAIGNQISATTTGISIEANYGPVPLDPADPPTFVSAQLLQNRINAATDIDLEVLTPPAAGDPIVRRPITLLDTSSELQLSAFNLGADVTLNPADQPGLFFGPPRTPVLPPIRGTGVPRPVPVPPPPSP
jgi:hypothetical protein